MSLDKEETTQVAKIRITFPTHTTHRFTLKLKITKINHRKPTEGVDFLETHNQLRRETSLYILPARLIATSWGRASQVHTIASNEQGIL